MGAKGKGSSDDGIVEVEREPNHVEQFRNESLRVYTATIEAGKETLPHRHRKDTLYIVIKGGWARSKSLEGGGISSYVFSKKFPPARLLLWGMQKLLFGFYLLPEGIFFLQRGEGKKVVHAVKAWRKNKHPLRLMGIELTRPAGREGLSWRKEEVVRDKRREGNSADEDNDEYGDQDFEIRRVELSPNTGEPGAIHIRGLIVGILGEASLWMSDRDSPINDALREEEVQRIGPGIARWCNEGESYRIARETTSTQRFVGLIVVPRKNG